MYAIQAQVVICYPSITYLPSELIDAEWIDIVDIPQLDSDADELTEARVVATKLREFYKNVRILKCGMGGLREIVVECPYTFAHTRYWCGNSACREG